MPDYPALYDFVRRSFHSIPGPAARLRVGRDPEADVVVSDQTVSRQQFAIARTATGCQLLHASNNVRTLVNGASVVESKQLTHGDLISCASQTFRFLTHDAPELLSSLDRLPTIGEPLPSPVGNRAASPEDHPIPTLRADLRGETDAIGFLGTVTIGKGLVIGRDSGAAGLQLAHPAVSRKHARIEPTNNGYTIVDLNSANGTYVDGVRITTPLLLAPGARIEVGPFRLEFQGDRLRSHSLDGNLSLAAQNLTVTRNAADGSQRRILDAVSLTIAPCTFTCILGPSGSGKTTLMNALSARAPATAGRVTINGIDLYSSFESLKQNIALVPQQNVLHDTLSVERALRFTAELRLPSDASSVDLDSATDTAIRTAGLQEHRQNLIRDLSGGQQRRASLANEILCKPNLLFLDEVTSGLDEQGDREMMELFRTMADGGMTVVCVTHSLANVQRHCHQVIVMATGGSLAFMGTPQQALDFFQVGTLGDIYLKLAERPAEAWRSAYHALPQTAKKRTEASEAALTTTLPPANKAPLSRILDAARRQLPVLMRRNVALALGDPKNLRSAIGQATIVGTLLVLLFVTRQRDFKPPPIPGAPSLEQLEVYGSDANLLFLLAIVSIWLGCNNAAKELVKEATIYRRERDAGLSIEGYLLAKSIGLHILGTSQVMLLWLFGLVAGIPSESASVFVLLHMLLAMSIGTHLGLLLSALAHSRDQAATLVPAALIPQIVLSGSVVKLSSLSSILAKLGISSYWVFCALTSAFGPEKRAIVKMGDQPGALLALFAELAHTTIFLALTLVVMVRREDASRAVYGAAVRDWVKAARAGLHRATRPLRDGPT